MSGSDKSDPLRNEVFDDLTAELDTLQMNQQMRSYPEGPDLGDSNEIDSINKYQLYSDEGRGGPGSEAGPLNSSPPGTDFNYGQLLAPPSYEDSIMCDSVPPLSENGHHHLPHQFHPPLEDSRQHEATREMAAHSNYAVRQAQLTQDFGKFSSSPSSPIKRSNCREQPLVVTVSEPQKREHASFFGLKGGYVTYLVITRVVGDLPGFTAGSHHSVRRRFSDFVTLASILKARYRGFFLPPRPHKNAVEGSLMSDAFLEERKAALEHYLQQLAAHPAAVRSEELGVFLRAEGDIETNPTWTSLRPAPGPGLVNGTAKLSQQLLGLDKGANDTMQPSRPTQPSADFLRTLRKATAQSLHRSPAGPATLPSRETELRKAKEKFEATRDSLSTASRAADKLTQRMHNSATAYGDLGLALFKLSKAEEIEGLYLSHFTGTIKQSYALSASCRASSNALVHVSQLSQKVASKTASKLAILHEQHANVPCAIKGLGHREKQLMSATRIQSEIETRTASIRDLEAAGSRVLGGNPAKVRKVTELHSDVARLESCFANATTEYERITDINQQELSRFHGGYLSDMLHMVQSFAALQLMNSERAFEVWVGVARDLQAPEGQMSHLRTSMRETQAKQQQHLQD